MKEKLVELVIEQIKSDIENDISALLNLLQNLPVYCLEDYLPKDKLNNYKEYCNSLRVIVYQDWTSDFLGKNGSDGWYSIDNGDEVFLKDKFKILPEITVTHYDQNIRRPNKGYFYLTDKVKETFI